MKQRDAGEQSRRRRYWRFNLLVVELLLAVWFLVSFVFGILLVDQLDQVRIGGFRFGFWFAQAGLLLVISTSVAHDLLKKGLKPDISERGELVVARIAAGVAVCIAGYFGINPPGFVAQVVAFAFGLAAASFFPAILMGIFSRRMNRAGAITGMLVGIIFTGGYIIWFKFVRPEHNDADHWLLGISPEGIGAVGMLLNFVVAWAVGLVTPPPPEEIQQLVDEIRVPRGAGEAHEIGA